MMWIGEKRLRLYGVSLSFLCSLAASGSQIEGNTPSLCQYLALNSEQLENRLADDPSDAHARVALIQKHLASRDTFSNTRARVLGLGLFKGQVNIQDSLLKAAAEALSTKAYKELSSQSDYFVALEAMKPAESSIIYIPPTRLPKSGPLQQELGRLSGIMDLATQLLGYAAEEAPSRKESILDAGLLARTALTVALRELNDLRAKVEKSDLKIQIGRDSDIVVEAIELLSERLSSHLQHDPTLSSVTYIYFGEFLLPFMQSKVYGLSDSGALDFVRGRSNETLRLTREFLRRVQTL